MIRAPTPGDPLLPDLALDGDPSIELRLHRRRVRGFLIRRDPRIDVAAKQVAQAGLGVRGEQIQAQICSPDRVRLVHDEIPARVPEKVKAMRSARRP